MPDVWETAQGLNPSSAADGPQLYASGYSNLERYLAGNTTKPTLSNLLPVSRHPASTTTTSLQVTTDRVSTCRYSLQPASPFTAMSLFATTGATSHSSAISVRSGEARRLYVKCQGGSGDLSDESMITVTVDPVLRRAPWGKGRKR